MLFKALWCDTVRSFFEHQICFEVFDFVSFSLESEEASRWLWCQVQTTSREEESWTEEAGNGWENAEKAVGFTVQRCGISQSHGERWK